MAVAADSHRRSLITQYTARGAPSIQRSSLNDLRLFFCIESIAQFAKKVKRSIKKVTLDCYLSRNQGSLLLTLSI